jgi:DNA replication protein DnaC
LVNRREETHKQYQLDRFLSQSDRTDLQICNESGYLSFSRAGAELLLQVFADRYERASLLMTSNLPFSEWDPIFRNRPAKAIWFAFWRRR